ncbi:flavin-dependent thymidylate synthase [Oscillospiraceae bacterium]|mgnify:CR=1 FL=1|uniref:FAD-dependent thymidylate synthase n=1 Tax=Allofournierella sp. TaxID=1940256 RepID=UPI0015ADCCBB|nr:flavin-dependent thymidylate synthase [Oscillospiraceae bacterium]
MLKVNLLAYTPEPEKVVAAAAKLCYSGAQIDELLAGLTPEKSREFVERLAKMGHESPTEHVSFTFAIEGVSRSLLAQITRHRIASYSVQSQRYVRLDGFEYVTPPEVAADPEASAAFEQAMRAENEQYERIAALLKEGHTRRLMREEGLTEAAAAKKAEKLAIEDARFVLPNACETKMIVTMNARSLHNFFRHRCCSRAQWEIRALADEMLRLVYPVAPALFAAAGPSCVKGACPEGAMSCGDSAGMRAKYASLKKGALN